jgi:hypothetical protein
MPPTAIYEQNSLLEYTLYNNHFQLQSFDASNFLDLSFDSDAMQLFDSKCRNQVRSGLNRCEPIDVPLESFYEIILAEKKRNNATPSHTLNDLLALQSILGDKFFYEVMEVKETKSKAGILYFKNSAKVFSAFYISQETEAKGSNILNALLYNGIRKTKALGASYLDLGTSSLNTEILNPGIIAFKESFGAKTLLRRKYVLTL